jgi:DNA-directed RNA polymerase subunit F
MIRNSTPLSMAESLEYLSSDKDSEKNVKEFIKKFVKISQKEAKELRKKLMGLNLIKMNETNICKLIDILPERPEEVNKIFVDVSLDENETKKILDTIKEFK